MCAHEKRPSHVRKTWYLFFYTGFRAATNIIKKCFLPFRLRILHLALEAADSIGQLSSLLRYPTFLLFPVLRRFLRLVSTSFNLLPLSNLKVNFRELPSGARITGLLLSVNPVVSIPSFSRGYPYLSGQHPRLRSAPICGTECFR